MTKKALIVGNCDYDGPRIVALIESNFDTRATEVKTLEEAETALDKEQYDLVTVNRVGDKDKRNGLELIDWIQQHQKETPIMLITNFEDKMAEAVKHGAVQGFGKQNLEAEETIQLLRKYLK